MLVMFDLPVGKKPERKAASEFRKFLQDQGFDMCQFSVYLRFCSGRQQVDALAKRIGAVVPSKGSVYILCFTDKQYENIISFTGRSKDPPLKNPEQYSLF